MSLGQDRSERLLTSNRWRWFVLSALTVLLFTRPLLDLSLLTLEGDDHYSHVGLIPLIFLYLIWSERERVFAGGRTKAWVAVFPAIGALVFATAGLSGAGQTDGYDHLSFMIGAFVAAYWAAFVLALGWNGARRTSFALLFLLFMIPFPTPVQNGIVHALLWGSGWVTEWMFKLTGTPILREGYTFSMPGLSIMIADECSGIRSTLALVITGLLAGHFLLRRWWSMTVLVLLLFPLSVFKNGLRIVSLSLLSIHVDPAFITGKLHREGGVVWFLITLGIMALLIKLLAIAEGRSSMRRAHRSPAGLGG
jgi:exosortase